MNTDNSIAYDPSEDALRLWNRTIIETARLTNLSAAAIAERFYTTATVVRRVISEDLARELGMIPSDTIQDDRD